MSQRANSMHGGRVYAAGLDSKRIQEEVQKQIPIVIQDTVDMYGIALANVLHDKCGFGQKRVKRVLEQVNSLCESMITGEIDIIDIREANIDDMGIIIGDNIDYIRR